MNHSFFTDFWGLEKDGSLIPNFQRPSKTLGTLLSNVGFKERYMHKSDHPDDCRHAAEKTLNIKCVNFTSSLSTPDICVSLQTSFQNKFLNLSALPFLHLSQWITSQFQTIKHLTPIPPILPIPHLPYLPPLPPPPPPTWSLPTLDCSRSLMVFSTSSDRWSDRWRWDTPAHNTPSK